MTDDSNQGHVPKAVEKQIILVSKQVEMDAFDKLPKAARDALNHASFNIAAAGVLHYMLKNNWSDHKTAEMVKANDQYYLQKEREEGGLP